jgi:ribosomal protein S18 acetylase RimI-like enzyme
MNADYDVAMRDHIIDLLHVDGELAGLIEMYPESDHLHIQNIAVSPAFQGHGYGRALLAHAEEVSRSLSFSEVSLSTADSAQIEPRPECRRKLAQSAAE